MLRTTIVYIFRDGDMGCVVAWRKRDATHRKPLVEFYYLSKFLLHYDDDERLIMRMSATFPHTVLRRNIYSHTFAAAVMMFSIMSVATQSIQRWRTYIRNNDERNL